jgi:hypothetical protein
MATKTTYTTRNEAIEREIIAAIEAGDASASEYDIEAIADAVLGDYSDGYTVREDVDFWAVVAESAR